VLTLLTALGAGRVDESSLEYFADRVRHAGGRAADETALAQLMAGGPEVPALFLDLAQGLVPLERCPSAALPARFGFVRDPGQQYGDTDSP